MRKNRRTPFKPYEGRKEYDKHIRITKDMMLSEVYMNLSYSSKMVYNFMKLWSCGKLEFKYSWSLASKYIGSNVTYIKAKDELIEKGFIECIRTAKCSRHPNMYRFIHNWQHWESK